MNFRSGDCNEEKVPTLKESQLQCFDVDAIVGSMLWPRTALFLYHFNGQLVRTGSVSAVTRGFLTKSSKRRKYNERRVLGWSPEQLYDIVARVDDYKDFLPACHKSDVLEREENFIKAQLGIGVPPLVFESYTSHVTLDRPRSVKAKCFEGKLFDHLDTEWNFIEQGPNTTLLDFRLDFEFKSLLHSKLANAMFDTMVHQTINAFINRARQRHGPPAAVNLRKLREEL